jgi:hypothetical protein
MSGEWWGRLGGESESPLDAGTSAGEVADGLRAGLPTGSDLCGGGPDCPPLLIFPSVPEWGCAIMSEVPWPALVEQPCSQFFLTWIIEKPPSLQGGFLFTGHLSSSLGNATSGDYWLET